MSQGVIILLILFGLIFLATPISFALGITGCIGIFMLSTNLGVSIPQMMYGAINYFPLLAIPFFVMAGEVMNKGKITERLINLSSLIIGRIPASLAQVNILTSMFFGGITGSAPADTSSVGSILIPAMKKEGYDGPFSVAVTAASSTIGPIIPPSIIMVVYGATTGVSVSALFAGGLLPGILVGLAMMVTVAILDRTHHFPRRTEKYSKEIAKKYLREGILPMGMPIIMFGGIASGVFTPTEAGAISVLYSVIVARFIMRTITFKDLIPMIKNTAETTAVVMFVFACAKIVAYVLTLMRVQVAIGSFFTTYANNKILFLLFTNILLLIMGTFMDGGASIILFAPILAPIAKSLGINPIQFGLVMCINLTIGHATPPLGTCLFIGCNIGKETLASVTKAILPFLASEIIILLLMTYVPSLSLTIPNMLGLLG